MAERFWIMDAPGNEHLWAQWDEGMSWGPLEGDPAGSIRTDYGGPAKRLTELRVMLKSRRMTDMVWTWYHDCLIQDRVLELFHREGFTGFQARPTSVRMMTKLDDESLDDRGRDQAGLQIPTFWELFVTGWGGVAPPESGMSLAPPGSRRPWVGLPIWARIVDESQWDGSDFFMVWPFPALKIVTDRVVRCAKRERITGVKFIPLEKYDLGDVARNPKPAPLSEYLPDDRVAELMERYDIRW